MHTVRFANALGTPNWYEPGLSNCFIPRITVSNLTYGGFVVGDYYGPVRPKCVLFWGTTPSCPVLTASCPSRPNGRSTRVA